MKPGKYLFIDIGSAETKIVEANIKNGKITLLNSAEMRDMSLYLSDFNVIKVIEGFCLSLKKTLEDNGIKSRKAFVCSSILGMTIKDISEDFTDYKDCNTRFNKIHSRTAEPSLVSDWQFMGEYVSDKDVKHKLIMTSGKINIIENFVLAMHNIAGVTLVGLESAFTTQSNIQTLYSATFDLPSIAIIDVGRQQVQCQYYKSGAYIQHTNIKSDILKIGDILAEKFSLPVPKVMYLLYNAGMNVDLCESILPSEGIDVDEYIRTVEELAEGLLTDIQKSVLSTASYKQLENVRVIFTGGLLSMPGMHEYIHKKYNFTPFDIMEIPSTYDTRSFTIINQLNKTLSSKYANCIGLALKIFNEVHTANLVPKELVLIDFGQVANKCTLGLIACAAAGIILSVALNIAPLLNCFSKQDIPEQLEAAEHELKKAGIENAEYASYLTNIDSINKSLTPFVQCLSSYETSTLKIASVDTANILEVQVNGLQPVEEDEVEGEDEEPEQEIVKPKNPLRDLVIRGYAKASEDITAFYDRLYENESIGALNMNGIREVKLNKQDVIYIFEIELEVVADA